MHAKDRRLRDAFNLTLDEWNKIWEYQGKACFICERPIEPPRKPHTDHDHKTGIVRGILCSQCNRALGKAQDPRWAWTIKCFRRAAMYLENYPAFVALGKIVRGYPGRIGTKEYRKWLKKKRNNSKIPMRDTK